MPPQNQPERPLASCLRETELASRCSTGLWPCCPSSQKPSMRLSGSVRCAHPCPPCAPALRPPCPSSPGAARTALARRRRYG